MLSRLLCTEIYELSIVTLHRLGTVHKKVQYVDRLRVRIPYSTWLLMAIVKSSMIGAVRLISDTT